MANWYQIAGIISMVYYLIASLKFYKNYKKLVFDKVSFADSILFEWIPNFLIAFLSSALSKKSNVGFNHLDLVILLVLIALIMININIMLWKFKNLNDVTQLHRKFRIK